MDAPDFLALCIVNFAAVTVVGVVVDVRASRRDAALRTYVAGATTLFRAGLRAMDELRRDMAARDAEGRGVSSTPPPTLQ